MSLQQLAAQRMAAQGRGPDTQLVHMSPREVAGLQALAMAQGGSLTINPETGLPEAGFLDSMLPMILGIGATALTGGAAAPWMLGLGVGALQTARTGSLEKGLMAGLGAYGGAGLAGGLMAAGAGAGAGAAGAGAAGSIGPQTAAIDALGAPMTQAATSVTPTIGAGTLGTGTFDTVGNVLDAGIQKSVVGGAAPVASPLTAFSPPAPTIPPAAAAQPSTIGQNFSQLGQGFKNLGTKPGLEAFMGQAGSKGVEATGVGGGMGLLKYGAAAAAPLLVSDTKTKMPAEDNERYNYRFDAGRTEEGYVDPVTGTRQYFRPTYTRYAVGGPVEDMSISNVYDMQNARGGVSDMGIDNSTGMQRMASGGISALKPLAGYGDDEGRNNYSYDPATKTYAKLAPVIPPAAIAATLNALEAGGYGGGEMGGGPAGPTSGGTYSGVTSASFDAANMGEGSLSSGGGPSGATAGAAGGTDAGGGTDYGSSGFGDYAGGGLAALAGGGISHLGDYSDGGRLLRGPGDGVSDSIPAMIGRKQPARLADGEFVVPARIVSELGNGSTEAGARKLYAMMDRVQKARGKTTGKNKVAKNTRADKYLPA